MPARLERADLGGSPLCLVRECASYLGYMLAYRQDGPCRGQSGISPLGVAARVIALGFGGTALASTPGGLAVDHWALHEAGASRAASRSRASWPLSTAKWLALGLAAAAAGVAVASGAVQVRRRWPTAGLRPWGSSWRLRRGSLRRHGRGGGQGVSPRVGVFCEGACRRDLRGGLRPTARRGAPAESPKRSSAFPSTGSATWRALRGPSLLRRSPSTRSTDPRLRDRICGHRSPAPARRLRRRRGGHDLRPSSVGIRSQPPSWASASIGSSGSGCLCWSPAPVPTLGGLGASLARVRRIPAER